MQSKARFHHWSSALQFDCIVQWFLDRRIIPRRNFEPVVSIIVISSIAMTAFSCSWRRWFLQFLLESQSLLLMSRCSPVGDSCRLVPNVSGPMPCDVRRNHGRSSTSIDPSYTHGSTISNITCFTQAIFVLLLEAWTPVGWSLVYYWELIAEPSLW